MDKIRKFFDIQKVDAATRMVYGYASTETLDAQGEIIKSEAIAEGLDDYMKFANIREMHKNSAVGVAKSATMDDKGLYIAAHIVDDAAWAKVEGGVYKGFSVGGKATSRDKVNKNVITGMRLSEISLVDRPANPEAVFDVYKADGEIESETSDDSADAAVDDTAAAVAASDAGTADNAETQKAESNETADEAEKVEKAEGANEVAESEVEALASLLDGGASLHHVVQAAEIIKGMDLTAEQHINVIVQPDLLNKSMYSVRSFANILSDIKALQSETTFGVMFEGYDPSTTARVKAWLKEGADIFIAHVQDEMALLTKAEESDDVEKAGARNSKADAEKIQTMHDHSVALGAACSTEKHDHAEDISKCDDVAKGVITKLGVTTNTLTIDVVNKMASRIVELEAMPTVGKGLINALVTKKQDIEKSTEQADDVEKNIVLKADGSIDGDATSLNLIKMVHKH